MNVGRLKKPEMLLQSQETEKETERKEGERGRKEKRQLS